MKDQFKKKQALIQELVSLRQRIAKLEQSESEHKRVEEALRQSEELHRVTIENILDPVFITDSNGKFTFICPNVPYILGYSINEIEAMGNIGALLGDPLRLFDLEELNTEGKITNIEALIAQKDGIIKDYLVTVRKVSIKSGTILYVCRDITERKRAENALRESEARFANIFNASPVAIAITRIKDGQLIDVNSAWQKVTGYSREEVIGRTPIELNSWVNPGERDRLISTMREQGTVQDFLFQLRHKSGNVFEMLMSAELIELAGERYMLSLAQDITERNQVEETLQQSEKRFRDIANSAAEWVWEVNTEGKYTYSSPVVEQLLGYKSEEILNKYFYDLFHPEDREEFRKAALEIFNSKKPFRDFLNRNLHKNGETVCLSTRGVPILDGEGNLVGYRGADTDITERKRAEDKLTESEKHYRMLFNAIDEGFCIIEVIFDENEKPIDYRFLEINPSFEKQTGLIDARGKRMRELAPKHEEYWFETYGTIAVTGQPARFVNRAEQLHRWYDVYAFRVGQPENRQVAILFNDITDRKQAEEELCKSEEYFRAITENATDIILVVDKKGTVTYASPSLDHILGYKPEELIGKRILDLIVPDDRPRAIHDFGKAVLTQGVLIPNAFRVRHNDGSERVLEGVGRNLLDNPSVAGFIMNVRDVTDSRKAEEAMRLHSEILAQIVESVHLIRVDDGVIIYTNQRFDSVFGYDRDELVGKHVSIINAPGEKSPEAVANEIIRSLKQSGGVWNGEVHNIRKDGSSFWCYATVSTFEHTEYGEVWISVNRDITERKRAEEALHAASVYNRSLIEASLDPLVTIGPDGRITDVNAETEVVTGYTRAELIGKDFSDYFTEPEKARAGYREVFRKNFLRDYPLEIRHRDGHVTSVLYNASVYRNAAGEVVGVFAAARDITERKEAEEQLRASLREKELLLREVQHRVKNNMQLISGLLDLQARLSGNPELMEMLREGQRRIQSMVMVHEKLYASKDFARIDLASYVRALSQELFQSYKINPGKIYLTIKTDSVVYVDVNKAIPCGLILNELITNALKHAFSGDGAGAITVIISESDSKKAEIVVRDNGLGLPDDVDIHEPRTVGLYLVNGLVKNQLDGQIEVRQDNGTEFRIKFPL